MLELRVGEERRVVGRRLPATGDAAMRRATGGLRRADCRGCKMADVGGLRGATGGRAAPVSSLVRAAARRRPHSEARTRRSNALEPHPSNLPAPPGQDWAAAAAIREHRTRRRQPRVRRAAWIGDLAERDAARTRPRRQRRQRVARRCTAPSASSSTLTRPSRLWSVGDVTAGRCRPSRARRVASTSAGVDPDDVPPPSVRVSPTRLPK